LIPIARPDLDENAIVAAIEVLRSGSLAQGKLVHEFEAAFAQYIDTPCAIATNSGTSALHLALLASGINKGDEVITSPFSFIASANAILYCGAKPVFADIESLTFNIDPGLIEAKITPKTRAVLGVHLYGQTLNIERVQDMCQHHNLILIEDACQAHGAEYHGKKAGSFGIGCFSFYPTKNMTTGEGGMVTTGNKDIADKCRMLRNHGQVQRYCHTMLGYNARMTEIAAAIGLSQLEKLNAFNNKRNENARILTSAINEIPGLIAPTVLAGNKHVFHQFTIRVTPEYKLTRDELKIYLEENGIGCGIHYPLPIHRQPLFKDLGYDESLPVAEKAACEVLSLPVHPAVSRDDLNTIIEVITNA